mmetsp:Transcript_15456/g.29506  ORF Transcript_15456/g.29506 Transcript_15456/m.29506 type:complete len:241 (+) Transcript_15456:1821-2543(+)
MSSFSMHPDKLICISLAAARNCDTERPIKGAKARNKRPAWGLSAVPREMALTISWRVLVPVKSISTKRATVRISASLQSSKRVASTASFGAILVDLVAEAKLSPEERRRIISCRSIQSDKSIAISRPRFRNSLILKLSNRELTCSSPNEVESDAPASDDGCRRGRLRPRRDSSSVEDCCSLEVAAKLSDELKDTSLWVTLDVRDGNPGSVSTGTDRFVSEEDPVVCLTGAGGSSILVSSK